MKNYNKIDTITDIVKYNSAFICNTSEKNNKNNIDDRIENKIKHIAGSFIKIQNVPGDRDCGAHSILICLLQHEIKKTALEIINMLNITKLNSGYNFRDDDLAYICDYFGMNLFMMAKQMTTLT